MSKGSGGGRTATATKAGAGVGTSGNTTNGYAESRVTSDNIESLQKLADKPGSRIISGISGKEIENDDKTFKVRVGDRVVPASDKRTEVEIRNDLRSAKDFAPVNQKVKGDPFKEKIGEGSRKAIEPVKQQFADAIKKAERLRETTENFKKAGAEKQASNFRKKIRETRKELLTLGKKIIDFEHKAGRTSLGTIYGSNFSKYL